MSYEQAEQKAIERLENRGIYAPETPEEDDPRRTGRAPPPGRTAAPAATPAAAASTTTFVEDMSFEEVTNHAKQMKKKYPNPHTMPAGDRALLDDIMARLRRGR